MNFIKPFFLTLLLSVLSSFAVAESDIKKWPTKSCSDLYSAIGFFTALSHKEWNKKKDEKKGAFYASVAADYSTIYETVCSE